MALGAITLAWLDHLAERSIIPPGAVLELGPQDVTAARPVVTSFLNRRLGPDEGASAFQRMYGDIPSDLPQFAERPQAEIYRSLGLTEYVSVDLGDSRADVNHDLNYPLDVGRRFQAVTNFGTGEHIFNVSTVFETQYRNLAVGGVALFYLPTFGHINHGFYNIHPTLFTDLAAANNMEIADFRYVDDVVGRTYGLDDEGSCQVDFDTMPVKPFEGQLWILWMYVSMNFLRNTAKHMKNAPPGKPPTCVLDCCMVALRRTDASPAEFRTPQQNIYVGPTAPAANPRQRA
ncbi:MAG: hypothetical protein RLO51_14260 [Thalassobaculum sp.]|uniref:hypothetical protein n=1 Tax=Thalassobaculum sp. TaxID=2022740 RepID=UPI0032EF65BD